MDDEVRADGGRFAPGTIGWLDLTVPDASAVRDFYAAVVGWQTGTVDMDGYHDFTMMTVAGAAPVAGICHARGGNADLPAQWLAYVMVEDLDASLDRCRERGGNVVAGPKGDLSQGRYCVIRDPAGAVIALMEHPRPAS